MGLVTTVCYTLMTQITGYCDVDQEAQKIKNVLAEGVFFWANNMISQFNKKQNCVSLSTVEAEYIAVERNCTQLIWMKQMLQEYDIS